MTTFIITVSIQVCEMRPHVYAVHNVMNNALSGLFFCYLMLAICTLFVFMAAARVKSPEQISHFCTSITNRPLVKAHPLEVDASFS